MPVFRFTARWRNRFVREDSAVSSGGRHFGLGRLTAAEQHRENNEDGCTRRIIRDSKQGGDIQACVPRWLPCDRRSNDASIGRVLSRFPNSRVRERSELHFGADLEPLVRKNNWDHEALGESDLAAAITAHLLFE